jgi:formate-dependent nitrite reductase membrane component NrfD
VDDTYIWAQPDAQRLENQGDLHVDPITNARVTLNTAHPRPWGWRVTTYLWTKAFAAGALAIAGIAMLLGLDLGWLGNIAAPVIGIVGVGATGALLVWDLKRPERFLFIFLKSNFTSWLVLGSYALVAFSGIAGLWFLNGVFGPSDALMKTLAVLAIPAAALTAGYTAFLFGQAEGRDLWQSPLLFWHLLAQATMVGTGALLVVGAFAGLDANVNAFLARTFVVAALVHVGMSLLEFLGRHSSRQAATAAHIVTHGRYAPLFWYGAIIGALAAAAIVSFDWYGGQVIAGLIGGLVAQGALLAMESAFVRAGQDVPLS